MSVGEVLATCSSAHLREDLNATWFAWEGFSEQLPPHRHRSRGTVRALGATVVCGAQFSECPWHLHMLIAVFKGYDVSGCANKSYGHEKKRKVPALPRAYLLSDTRIKETSDDAGTHVSYGNSCCFGFVACVCARVCFTRFITLGVEYSPSAFASPHLGYAAAVPVA